MLMLFIWILGTATASDCQSPREISSESIQVAWISRSGKRVAGRSYLEVVRTGDLRTWLDKNGRDPLRLLRGLGDGVRRLRGGRRRRGGRPGHQREQDARHDGGHRRPGPASRGRSRCHGMPPVPARAPGEGCRRRAGQN